MKNFLLQNVVLLADIFPVLWQFLKNAAKSFHFLASPPPRAKRGAKNVRAIFNIEHTLELVKLAASPLRGSAAELNGIFQTKLNF